MVFEALINGEDGIDRCFVYDNVESASVYYSNEVKENVVSINLIGSDEPISFAINRKARLYDNTGKQIKEILPFVKT